MHYCIARPLCHSCHCLPHNRGMDLEFICSLAAAAAVKLATHLLQNQVISLTPCRGMDLEFIFNQMTDPRERLSVVRA